MAGVTGRRLSSVGVTPITSSSAPTNRNQWAVVIRNSKAAAPGVGCGGLDQKATGWRSARAWRCQRALIWPLSSDSTISTRRFSWRPAAVSLLPTGLALP